MKNNKLLIILSIVFLVFFAIIIVLLVSIKEKSTFKKPEFDKEVSKVPENFEFEKSVLNISKGYSIYISPNPKVFEDDYLKIDLVSIPSNEVYVKVRVLDKTGEVIGETGLLKAGDYLEKVKLNKKVEVNEKLIYKIMGYEVDTYISAGSVSLNTKVGE